MSHVLFQTAFRPFFLLVAAICAVVPAAWGLALIGAPVPMPTVHWHASELVFGALGGVLVGFLLTAGSVWTGRVTARGPALAALALAWLIGRFVASSPIAIASWIAPIPDVVWLVGAAVALGRAVLVSRNWRNLPFVVLLVGLAAARVAVAVSPAHTALALDLALQIVAVALVIVTARIVPAFTRGALPQSGAARWSAVEWTALALVVAALGLELVARVGAVGNLGPVRAAVFGAAAVALAVRIIPWGTRWTLRVPLLLVLHVGAAWISVAYALLALDALGAGSGVTRSVGLHALGLGAALTLTLGMMARVALGHTGRPLTIGWHVAAAFAMLVLAGVVRVAGGLFGVHGHALGAAALLASAAFTIYLFGYSRVLLSPRADGRPG